MRIGISGFVPSARLTANDGKRIGRRVVRHPETYDSGFEHFRRPRRLDLRKKALRDGAAGPNMRRRQSLLHAPGLQRAAHAANRARRILPSHDRLVQYALHTAFRGKLGDAKRILLTLMRMAVYVDGVCDAGHVVERGVDGLFVAAPGGIRCHRANDARGGVIGASLSHGQSSLSGIDWTISLRYASGNSFPFSLRVVKLTRLAFAYTAALPFESVQPHRIVHQN